jgi:catechol 2,3-dioxygenase-like lactoylglutathione lyase family enzyme
VSDPAEGIRNVATRSTLPSRLHHVGVQAYDLAGSLAWYREFFGGEPNWTLETFSELTRSRLPGIRRLTELVLGDFRIHLFERAGATLSQDADPVQFQHLCFAVGSPGELRDRRAHWIELFASGRHRFARPDPPTEIVVDDHGVQSFYCYDVNGLEFEFSYLPEEAP